MIQLPRLTRERPDPERTDRIKEFLHRQQSHPFRVVGRPSPTVGLVDIQPRYWGKTAEEWAYFAARFSLYGGVGYLVALTILGEDEALWGVPGGLLVGILLDQVFTQMLSSEEEE